MVTEMSRQVGAHEMTFQAGKLAKLADGAVVVTYGQTQVIATCVRSKPREGIDFFPLTIDVEERAYAAGKIPGSFFRREGRPGETAILTARLIDRPLRPTFKEGFRDEVQVVVTVLSVDMANPYDIPAMNAAACAVGLAGLPFDGPVAAVRLGLIGGEWVVNPTFQEVDDATFDIVVAGSKGSGGGVDILMIEGEAPENTWPLLATGEGAVAPTEEVVAQGLEVAKAEIGQLIAFQEGFIAAHGVTEMDWEPTPLYGEDIWNPLYEGFAGKLEAAIVPDREARDAAFGSVKEEAKTALATQLGEEAFATRGQEFSAAWKSLQKKVMRRRVVEQGVRLDGRGATDIRPLSAEVNLVPRAHGSALFNRGDTQVLNISTLGMLRMTQMIDTLDPEDSKRYMHHYNFPPYSTGETGRVGSPRRREIGHGALAERALIPVDPERGGVPLRAPARVRRDVVQRLHVDGERLRLHPVADGRGGADQGAGRGHRDGHDRRRRPVRDAHRHPGRRGRARRHGLQGRRDRGLRDRDPARHEGRRDAGRRPRRRAAAGEGGAPQDPRGDAGGDPRASRRGEREGPADHHDPDPRGQDRRGDRARRARRSTRSSR